MSALVTPAFAATQSRSFAVTATVAASCTIAIPLQFVNPRAQPCRATPGAFLNAEPVVTYTPNAGGDSGAILTITF